MKRHLGLKGLVVILIIISACTYLLHYLIFRDLHHIAIFFLHDVAFLPLEVILVSLVFDKAIERTHKHENWGKLNIIESIFFNESGADMLKYLNSCDEIGHKLRDGLRLSEQWGDAEFAQARQLVESHDYNISAEQTDFFALHYHLGTRHTYFLKVIENPSLMEHETFTDLILAMYQLWEELEGRLDLYNLPADQQTYLAELTSQVYRMLTSCWMTNVKYMRKHHPSRFSCAVRTNPFAC